MDHMIKKNVSLYQNFMTWFLIITQVSLPLMTTFIPINMANAAENNLQKSFFSKKIELASYTLKQGENIQSVAKKLNMTVDELKMLNSHRVFENGFDSIRHGDVITIPLSDNSSDELASSVAKISTQVGSFLSNTPNSQKTEQLIKNLSTSYISSELEDSLSKYLNTRINIELDDDNSFKNSQAEILYPFWEQDKLLWFLQGGIHRTDNRNQTNWGLGIRYFADNYMLGGNTFLDYDFSHHHSRLGIGIEYWRDYLKLSTNTYARLSNWKTSPNFIDYQERPANGWDIRAESYLPIYPYIGGQLIYEQYYGDQVGLFGKDKRQKDPHAFTFEINYTPISLITLTSSHRVGKSGENDTSIGLQFNYKMGQPWSKQTSTIPPLRTIARNKYDFVNRNNNIVLEYRKLQTLFLKIAQKIEGYAEERKSLGLSVNSKYSIERVDISANELLAAGGQIVQNSVTDYEVILPPYQYGGKAENTYTIRAIALDDQGNRSNQAESVVTVTQAAINVGNSTLSPSIVKLPADGKSQQEITLTVLDSEGQTIDVAENEISIEHKNNKRLSTNLAVSDFKRIDTGQYTSVITAGTRPEKLTITPKVRGSTFNSTQILIEADQTTAKIQKIELIKDNAKANGLDNNIVHITVSDKLGNSIANQPVFFEGSEYLSYPAEGSTNEQGELEISVNSTTAAKYKLQAKTGESEAQEITMNFIPDTTTARILATDFSITPESAIANGLDKKQIVTKVTDANGNKIPNIEVNFLATNNAQISETNVITDIDGVASTQIFNKVAGTTKVTATVNNTPITKDTIFIGNNITAMVSEVNVDSSPYIADGQTTVMYQALIKDENGNILSDVPVNWSSNRDSSIVKFAQTQTITDSNGIARTYITSTQAFDVIVTAATNFSSKEAKTISFIANKNDAIISTMHMNKQSVIANGEDDVEATIKVTDQFGNSLEGILVNWQSTNAIISTNKNATDKNGEASINITSIKAGVITIQATLDNGKSKELDLKVVADVQTAQIKLSAETNIINAGDVNGTMITALVVDKNGNALPDLPVTWRSSSNRLSTDISLTDSTGRAYVNFTGTIAGSTTISGILINKSFATTNITITPNIPNASQSSFVVSPQTITASGKIEAQGKLILKDQYGNLVPKQQILFSSDSNGITFSNQKEIEDGIYTIEIAGTNAGVFTLNAIHNDISLSTSLAFIANSSTATLKSVNVVGTNTAIADGNAQIKIQAQIEDEYGNTNLKDVAIGWKTTIGNTNIPISKTNAEGKAEISITSREAGEGKIYAILSTEKSLESDKAIIFTAGQTSAQKSTMKVTPSRIIADAEKTTVEVILRDDQGNPLSGLSNNIILTSSVDLQLDNAIFTEVATGHYQASITGKKAGQTSLSISVNSVKLETSSTLTLIGNPNSAKVKNQLIDVNPREAIVGTTITYHAVLIDENNNPLGEGIPVTWNTNSNSYLASPLTVSDENGEVTVTLVRYLSGQAETSLILPSGTTNAPSVTFKAGIPDENQSSITLYPENIVAGKNSSMLTLILRDKNGNLLSGQNVEGIVDNSAVELSTAEESEPGIYNVTVKGKKIGTAKLGFKVNSTSFIQKKTLNITGNMEQWRLKDILLSSNSMIAGDEKGITYATIVEDIYGNRLSNAIVSWQLDGVADTYTKTSRTNNEGIAETVVYSKTAGKMTMTAYLDEFNYLSAPVVTVEPSAVDISKSTFTLDKDKIGADGKEHTLSVVTLIDMYGNPISGKSVLLAGSSSLIISHNPMQNVVDNRYESQITSLNQGQYQVTASVDNKKVGDTLSLTVGPMTPELRFDNAVQNVIYTKTFTKSQSVKGVPVGVQQMWSSSNSDIADVNSQGVVTLKKAGEVTITVQTSGNNQYSPASASYQLAIERAVPGLTVAENQIIANWADGKTYMVTPKFTNTDVDSPITVAYTSSNPSVATVATSGSVIAKKPGTSTINIQTQETDQFKAASLDVHYILNKGTVNLTFAQSTVKTTDETTNFSLPKPVNTLPDGVLSEWTSSDNKVIPINSAGIIQGKIYKGKARITLNVKENDYYKASNNYYDVIVYSKPTYSIANIKISNNGNTSTNSNISSSLSWSPVYKDDNLTLTWSILGSAEYDQTTKVTANLKQSDGKVLNTFQIDPSLGTKETTFAPIQSYIGKQLYIEIILEGNEGLKTSFSSGNITAKPTKPTEVGTINTTYKVKYIITAEGVEDDSCRASYMGKQHHALLVPTTVFSIPSGKTLISSITIKHLVTNPTSYTRSVDFENSKVLTRGGTVTLTSISSKYAIGDDCWQDHYGTGQLETQLQFMSINETQSQGFYWQGNGQWGKN